MPLHLEHIYIKGLKDPEREINLTFSSEPITVIYGPNGCGKTTFLKVLQALLNGDVETLKKEKVEKMELTYQIPTENDTIRKKLIFKNNKIDKTNNSEILNTSSVFLGEHRGMVNSIDTERIESNIQTLREYTVDNENVQFPKEVRDITEMFFDYTFALLASNENHKKHKYYDMLTIKEVGNFILSEYQEGFNLRKKQVENAWFETIENGIEIEENEKEQFMLPNDFKERLNEKKNFLQQALAVQEKESKLTKRLLEYLETGDEKLTKNSKLFRALLLNILEKAESENLHLEALETLEKLVTDYLYGGKKLIINEKEVYIFAGIDKEGNEKRHSIEDLSSGERNLLSIFTTLLIEGRKHQFIIIDEPEISLSLNWQRIFLPLIHRFSRDTQIIVASHSPSISHGNTQYLVELT